MRCPLLQEVLQLVLQHVELPQRFGLCALVCHDWHAAANAATSSISATVGLQCQAAALSGWLQQHGGQVEQLQVAKPRSIEDDYLLDDPRPDLDLPCQQLTKLDKLEILGVCVRPINSGTEGCSKRGSSSSGGSSPSPQQQHLAALTQLTQLRLEYLQWNGSLQSFSALTSLRQLQLHSFSGCRHDDAALGDALSHLVQLTSLQLSSCHVSDATFVHISRLQQLQVLELADLHQPTSASLAAVPQSLTRLVLRGLNDITLSRSTTPALAQLTALQHFELKSKWCLEPVLLSRMAQLTRLCLCRGKLQPAGSAGAAALLTAIANMTLLQHLELDCLNESHAPAAAYAALTASNHLTYLRVGDDKVDSPLPAGALSHMFAAGRQLPSLQHLHATFRKEQQQAVSEYWPLRQQRFDQLLQCCPGLQSLDLRSFDAVNNFDDVFVIFDGEYPPPIKLGGLRALSGLTELILKGLLVDEDGITKTLVRLTGLQQLSIDHCCLDILHSNKVEYSVLLQLTTLQRLESLQLHNGYDPQCPPVSLYSGYPTSFSGSVSLQLRVLCVSNCRNCAQQMLLQLDKAQAHLAKARQQQAQLAQHQAQQATYKAQLKLYEAQLAQHKAQEAQHQTKLAQYETELAGARQQLAVQQTQHQAQQAQHEAQLAQYEAQLAWLQQQLQ